ncbi:MAG: hypothetical protein IBX41_05595 [Methanophagales archaeon]|nr:hypothetical protein [Methanophagales archaeon]
MRVKRRRKPKISKDELRRVAQGLDRFGEMLVMMGEIAEIDKELRNLEKVMRKLFLTDPLDVFTGIEEESELLAKVVSFTTKLVELSSMMEKDPFEMSPAEQIEAGRKLKEFSSLLKEIAEGIG